MLIPLHELDRPVAFCDPASGKHLAIKRVRARSAIIVAAQDWLGRVFVLSAWADRCPTSQLVERIFAVEEQWNLRTFGIEANAMQSLFADMVGREAFLRGLRVPLYAVTQDTKVDKDWRIRTALQPVIAQGRLVTQEYQHELRSELRNFPMSSTKDLVDALASAVNLLPKRATKRQQSTDLDSLAVYLRNSGASPDYIRGRLAEVASGAA